MAEYVKLSLSTLEVLREQNPMLMSYNVEFAEVTGGTFWKAYTPEQVAGTEEFYVAPIADGASTLGSNDLMQVFPPINLSNEKLRNLAKQFGPVWIRVSGTWATKTYYDFDGEYTDGAVPDGYLNVLTKEQWIGVLDFVKAVGGKLLVSVSNCEGLHTAEEPWNPSEAEKLFAFSKEYGVPIEAAEFANEPNMLSDTGFPPGYTDADYRRDQDLFFAWIKENYPECICVGPSTVGGDNVVLGKSGKAGIQTGGVEQLAKKLCNTDELLEGTKVPLDMFSYHCYYGVSERLATAMPGGHWPVEETTSEAYLGITANYAHTYAALRDRYVPGGEMWITESGDAGGGGNTWASTYLEVIRLLNELGSFSTLTTGVSFHNTLAASDYGFLQHGTFNPRPSYFAALLWNQLMGTTVYDSGEVIREGAHVYAHSRKDGEAGVVYLIINNSVTESTTVELPKDANRYTLAGKDGNIRASVMTLNGRDLVLGEGDVLPSLEGELQQAGTIELAPTTCTFLVM